MIFLVRSFIRRLQRPSVVDYRRQALGVRFYVHDVSDGYINLGFRSQSGSSSQVRTEDG